MYIVVNEYGVRAWYDEIEEAIRDVMLYKLPNQYEIIEPTNSHDTFHVVWENGVRLPEGECFYQTDFGVA